MYWALLLVVVCTCSIKADVLRVCAQCQVQSVEDAVARAQAGDTIFIESGLYRNTHATISKSLIIIGRNRPVLDGDGRGTVLTISGASVHIRGIVIANTGYSAVEDRAGILLLDSYNSTIQDVATQHCAFGVILYRSANCRVENINAIGTGAKESQSGNGIHLWKSPSCTVVQCNIRQHRDGLYFEFSRGCNIAECISTNNMRYGLHFMFSDSNVYRKNRFEQNGAGVAVMYSQHVRMESNIFADNWGPSSYGLLLKDISRSTVFGNVFRSNTVGIYMEGSNQTTIVANIFHSNGWALKALGSCSDDTVCSNDFIANTFDVLSNTSSSEFYCDGNYWEQYRGYDLDHDGYGDVPYRPVSVFSILVERIPMAVLLLRSFIVELLAYMERAIPSLIPVQLVDRKPCMMPIATKTTRNQYRWKVSSMCLSTHGIGVYERRADGH
ncbi:MAG: nitrous oxide reductase family maturation protein NosD [Chlorobi bacterium]|nr:nitrous oxide reductase family maturation protein NosD [Chlorobiota bacterium]